MNDPFRRTAGLTVSRAAIALFCLFLLLSTVGCSNFTRLAASDKSASTTESTAFLKDGSITVARPFPEPVTSEMLAQPGFKAFLPPIAYQGGWITINKEKGTVAIMSGDVEAHSFPAEGIQSIPTGQYNVVHKQRNPLWYASDDYFARRQLPVPPDGDRGRFRRGALGNFAVFLTKDLPIHCGPLWSDEIGGIKMAEPDLSKLYYMIELGAPIKVQ